MRRSKLSPEEVHDLILKLRVLPTQKLRNPIEDRARVKANWQVYEQLAREFGISAQVISTIHSRRLHVKAWQNVEALEA